MTRLGQNKHSNQSRHSQLQINQEALFNDVALSQKGSPVEQSFIRLEIMGVMYCPIFKI